MDNSLKYNMKFIKIRQMYELFEKGFPKNLRHLKGINSIRNHDQAHKVLRNAN